MAATNIAVTNQPGAASVTPVALAFTAVDAVDGGLIAPQAGDIVIVRNVHASTAKTVTVLSVADPFGRTDDISAVSLPASTHRLLPLLPAAAWVNTADGKIHVAGEDADIEFAVIRPVAHL